VHPLLHYATNRRALISSLALLPALPAPLVILGGSGDERIERVAADIAGYAKHIDLLVITHEHYDHLSGFQALLDTGVTIGELWMAWTEDPTDSQAQALQDAFGKGRKALAVVTKLTTMTVQPLARIRFGSKP